MYVRSALRRWHCWLAVAMVLSSLTGRELRGNAVLPAGGTAPATVSGEPRRHSMSPARFRCGDWQQSGHAPGIPVVDPDGIASVTPATRRSQLSGALAGNPPDYVISL